MQKQNQFNPEMLILARQSRGYGQSELSQLLCMSPGWLSRIEAGLREITPEWIRKIAEILDYPVSFFYRDTQLYGPGISEMFNRSHSKVPIKTRDKNQACSEIHRLNIERLLSGVDIGDIKIPQFDIYEFDGDIRNIARAVRAKWSLSHGPIKNVVKTIEVARGIVIPIDFESRLVDATSCWPRKMPPLFFIGTNFPTDRMRFSLSHELGHVVMHQDNPNPYQEYQANQFAAEFLMPEDDIRPYLSDINLPKLATLKPYWKVSMAALLKRAKDLNTITERHAKTLWIEMGKAGYRVREPLELDLPKEEPKLLEEIIGVYCNQMGYSIEELAKLFDLHPHEVCHIYFGAPLSNRQEEVDSVIKEAERILREYRR
jgi:Zn-dependent peptidase ImmA (M78 family)/transcriptional regulator with XRE-family HTH domain